MRLHGDILLTRGIDGYAMTDDMAINRIHQVVNKLVIWTK